MNSTLEEKTKNMYKQRKVEYEWNMNKPKSVLPSSLSHIKHYTLL